LLKCTELFVHDQRSAGAGRGVKMKAYWDFLLSALQAQLGKDLGLLIAWMFSIMVVLILAAPLYMIMRAATKLPGRRDEEMGMIPGPVILSPSVADPFASSQPDASQAESAVPPGSPELPSRIEMTMSSQVTPGTAPDLFRSMIFAIVAIALAGVFLSRLRTPNGVFLLPIIFIAIAFVLVMAGQMSRRRFSVTPSIRFGQELSTGNPLVMKVSAKDSLVVKLDKDAIQKARGLLSAGSDLDSVCREIEPAYANWGFLGQEAFRKALEILLKTQQASRF